MSPQIAFRDLPSDSFPFTLEFLRADTHEIIRTEQVAGPGVIRVPPLANMYGVAVGVRVTYPDGEQEEHWPT